MRTASVSPIADGIRFGPRNFIRASVLLLLKEHDDHGYGLVERLGALDVADGNPGAVYRTLRSLESSGMLTSAWKESAAGPPKRVYGLTTAGEAMLDEWTRELMRANETLTTYLGRYRAAITGCGSSD